MSRFAAPIAEQIWDMKYRLKEADGTPIDRTVEDTWRRIARALASVEKDPAYWEEKFYEALEDFKYLPAGRITAGAGTGRSVTLFNCFVMGTIPDSMSGIFDMLKEAALTMQQGGGIGYDFSTIRPKGADVKGVAADASGPLSFMDVWDSMCRTIMSAGSRRGAMMATMRCDHPDIEDFITAKSDAARLRMFNVSVLVTDAFMEAVKADGPWELVFDNKVYRTVQARDLWNQIMQSTYDYAEPGVIFIDRINQSNNLAYCETIAATNPCGEQPLPPYGACLLGSVNLARLVRAPFEADAALDLEALKDLVRVAVRMMDNVVDASRFPLEAQAREAQAKRRIGLGVTGLADALLMLGLRYGADDAVAQSEIWMKEIAHAAYWASVELAREKGAFPLFDAEAFLASGNMAQMDQDLREAIAKDGIRNALLTSIAPTGTISLYAGNVSSGIEPVFAYSYTRKVLQRDGSRSEEEVTDYAVKLWREKQGDAELPAFFVNAQTLAPADHVRMQAAAQKWVDSSISKTINVPQDISFEAFKDVYLQAYETGCKGCTTYRPNDVTGSVLSVSEAEAKPDGATAREASTGEVVYISEPLERPQTLEGNTYKLKWPDSPHAIYITINDVVLSGHRRPFEVFINSKNMEHYAWTVALTRMMSAVFRRGGDVSFVVEELKAVFDPRGGAWIGGKYVPSILAAIGGVIERHLISIGFISGEGMGLKTDPTAEVYDLGAGRTGAAECNSCGSSAMRMSEGCMTCTDCGYSKCG
ncbi:MAG: adenosylcobalamin-dependent ribonucleoside-diphosphate reductase [Rhodobacteraceae bacterium]|jgi:ribonucleoside-diphosphate reductase alpha chain|uniref:adenosylcobalamin-dependent ribonucleoside-diphosphate reductase n=1 Tax=Roseovarius sp. 10 TaxID=3080563 RepID=UPI001937D582|nr:adenosylcobalamin-dependent ribonucleoside-diphosphate reductase [Roseovarius sp. 10]MBE1290250.1 adenosylcobalamin-dependent ribonucleoside-diphosphate reductase [Paracoccaceae bacterium]MBF9053825.1 adenosylcobalamin-dependent ribonucleoside-diphosphate reductase [Rhodobacterales bacterium LSUCC1028]MDV7201575.1 adenosylcobalamin-dependent ribonucleoside-diphosphate reductase [Roseovarius sp. 10]QPI84375.1 adenosylcobalamin-dependent ribonucleoside-diphosphate reductase [Rhodobacterales ba